MPVLVEKPIARSLAEADEVIDAAGDANVILAVGHTERFNPALAAARPLVTDPRFIEVHRLGTFPERSLDIDVVFDLMIHDLDVVLSLVDSDVESLEAVGVPVITNRVDIANARLRFANGCIVNLTASRISRDRVRKIRFFQPSTYVSIDYATQKVEVYRLVKGGMPAPADAAPGRPAIEGGEIEVANEEPLKRELADFVDARWSEKRAPKVTGEAGRRALSLAQDDRRQDDEPRRSRDEGFMAAFMYSDLNDFLADLDKRKLLARIADAVSPDLEIAAVTDRVCKIAGRRPGAAVRETDRLRHPGGRERLRLQ